MIVLFNPQVLTLLVMLYAYHVHQTVANIPVNNSLLLVNCKAKQNNMFVYCYMEFWRRVGSLGIFVLIKFFFKAITVLKSLFFLYTLSVHRYFTIIKGVSCLETKIMLFYFYTYSQDFRNCTKTVSIGLFK